MAIQRTGTCTIDLQYLTGKRPAVEGMTDHLPVKPGAVDIALSTARSRTTSSRPPPRFKPPPRHLPPALHTTFPPRALDRDHARAPNRTPNGAPIRTPNRDPTRVLAIVLPIAPRSADREP